MSSELKGKLLEEHAEGSSRVGLVEFDGKRRTIYLDLVPSAHTGDYVWFHSAFATELFNETDERLDGSPRSMTTAGHTEIEQEVDSYHAYHLLSEIEPPYLRKLLPLSQDKHYAADEIIFNLGDNSLFLHLIVAGEVALEDQTGRHVQTLGAGDAMGWSALIPAARTHFQARALSQVSTVAFAGEQLRAACKQDPAMGYELMVGLLKLVTERLDALRQKLQS